MMNVAAGSHRRQTVDRGIHALCSHRRQTVGSTLGHALASVATFIVLALRCYHLPAAGRRTD